MSHVVWVFFYGSYMNFNVLREVQLAPERWEKARLFGYRLDIQPRANLVKSECDHVYGIVATSSHAELERLYAHARDILGEVYLPEAVLTETFDGSWRPALCYISHNMIPALAEDAYVQRIAKPAREFGFPEWYVEKINSFRSANE